MCMALSMGLEGDGVQFVPVEDLDERTREAMLGVLAPAFPRSAVSELTFTHDRRGSGSVAALAWDMAAGGALLGCAFLDQPAGFPAGMRVLNSLAVAEGARNKGVGARLLREARTRQGGLGVALYVDIDTEGVCKRLLSFYVRNGFRVVRSTQVVPLYNDVEYLLVSCECTDDALARL